MPAKERIEILRMLEEIKEGKISAYDIKKLRGFEHVYRIRKGNYRIIFYMVNRDSIRVISIERRSETTYR